MGLSDLVPYLVIVGQLLILFKVEQRWIQGGLLAVLAFQLWRKFGQGGHRQQVGANKEE